MTRSDAKENRQLILDSLAATIKNGRLPLPTMSDIVRETGLGRGTVYRHFADIGELYFAYLQEAYTEICSSYEPEWIKGGDQAIWEEFEKFLRSAFKFNLENHSLLCTPSCLTSQGMQLIKVELRRKVFVTATLLSKVPLKPIELAKWSDVVVHCVETEHLMSYHILEAKADISVGIAIGTLKAYLKQISDRSSLR